MKKLKEFFHHLFIPNEKNNFRAKSLHTDFLTFYLLIAFTLNIVFKQVGINNVLGFATDISVEKLYQLVNKEREKNNLPPLIYNQKLATAAYEKAKDMFSKNYWAHFSPDGKTPWDFILNSGYKYEYAGENLAKNFLFSDGVVSAWMNSKTHKENILKPEYTEVGYAVVNGILNNEETTLVVQMFAKPLNSNYANQTETNKQVVENKLVNSDLENILEKQNSNVLSENNQKKSFKLPLIFYNINLVFLSFLILALAFDFYFAVKFNIIKIGGKNIAHFIFISFIIIGLLIFSKGAIL